MKILLLGSEGQLGSLINQTLSKKKGFTVYKNSRKNFDLSESNKLTNLINTIQPNIIINCSAFTNVDQAEIEKKKSLFINSTFLKNLSNLCLKNNSILIHFSTDYVFDGLKGNYKESYVAKPINYYGLSKLMGEDIIKKKLKRYIIIRTSWLYSNHKNNFFTKIKSKIKNNDQIQVIDDQFGFPTSAYDLSLVTFKIINFLYKNKKLKFGIYHYSNYGNEPISWYDFAVKIGQYLKKYNNLDYNIFRVKTDFYKVISKRPKNSSLNIDKICNTFNISKKKWHLELKKIILMDF